MNVDAYIVIEEEGVYRRNYLGILAEVMSDFRSENYEELQESLLSFCHVKFRFEPQGKRVSDLLEQCWHQMGLLHGDTDLLRQVCKPAFGQNGIVYRIDDCSIGLDIIDRYIDFDSAWSFLLFFNGNAGEVFRGEVKDCHFYFHSHEGKRHNIPHVHICYRHEIEAVYSLTDGSLLSGIKLPGKVDKIIRSLIADRRCMLLEFWNNRTDGMHVDLDEYLGASTWD